MEGSVAFSGACVAAEVGSLPYADQVARLRELEAAHRRLEAELSLTVVALAESAGFKADGHASVRALLRAELRWSEGDVTHRLRTGRLLADLPDVVDALGNGEVGVAQVHDLARARANPRCGSGLVEHANLLLGFARQLQYSDFHRCVRRWELLADTDGAHRDAEAVHESRHASLRERDGVGYLAGQGGALDTAEMQEIWDAFAQAEFMSDADQATALVDAGAPSAPLPRTESQRRWDALMAIFRTAAGQPVDTKLPEPTLNIVMDITTFEAALAELNLAPRPGEMVTPFEHRRSETASGVLVDPVQAVQAALLGHVRRVVVDSAGNVIDLGRRRRLFTGAARAAVMLHSPRCIWPGCATPAGRCDADHTHDWQHGGVTAPTNGGPMCPRHDRHKNGGYRVRRDATGIWHTYRPDGSEIGEASAA